MRPVKFFLLLLFAAAVLITFLKILLFTVFAALFVGGAFMISRAFGWRRRMRRHAFAYNQPEYGVPESFDYPRFERRAPFAEPIDPGYRRPFADNPFTRTITVQ